MDYSINQINKILNGHYIQNYSNNSSIKFVLTDSRQLFDPEATLFFAIKTSKNDGANYIDNLYQKHVRNFVVHADFDIENFSDAHFIVVDDTLKALQTLAAHHRKQYEYPVIGITGSNGKTIIKEWLYQLLNQDLSIVRSPRSYNSQIGVPLSVLQMKKEHELAIIEAGISQPNEMATLRQIIQPTIGILCHMGTAHDEGFANHEEKINEKLNLFSEVNTLLIQHKYKPQMDVFFKEKDTKLNKIVSWSFTHPDASLYVFSIEKREFSSKIDAQYVDRNIQIIIPFTDKASIENAIYCWLYMLELGYDAATIASRMRLLHPISMRLEINKGINQCTVINDSYNSDIQSLSIALDLLNQQNQHGKKTVILSDILQGKKDKHELYYEVGQLLKRKNIDKVIGIGKDITVLSNFFDKKMTFYASTDDFLKEHSFYLFQHEAILLKGARTFAFEKIGQRLQEKDHETVMEINLSALINNFNYYKNRLDPGVKIMAMVKAFSYGAGSYEVCNALQFNHADYLSVAYADEGVALREAGITLPIMVMNTEKDSFDSILLNQLEPEIYNYNSLQLLIDSCNKNLFTNSQKVKIHIKIDTGMKRLGFLPEDVPYLIEQIKKDKRLKVASVFSHLVASDVKEEDDFTNQQIQTFKKVSDLFSHAFDYKIIKHILNSAGITRFPQAQFDMVRLGISLYGIASDIEIASNLIPVSSLRSTISQVKQIKKGETVGYNRNFKAEKDMKIATVSIGYADGLSRALGNGKGQLLYNHQFVPIVGNICMDMCMIDVTDVNAKEGDKVWIFNEEYPVTKISKQLNTIPYEVLTGISQRVKRVYYQE